MNEVLLVRNQYKTFKKAKIHAKKVLPPEPKSLVDMYLEGKDRPSKEYVVANRNSRFSTPALPANREEGNKPCVCKGKCTTKKCECRAADILCEKCKNRE